MEVLERVYNDMTRNRMVKNGQVVIVGVSGGLDSVVLLHILKCLKAELGISLHVAHLNHMIRGEEAREDALFVRELCSNWGIPCAVEERNVPAYAYARGLSSEVAAREVRYQFYDDVRKETRGHKIALAHHANDQAESVLMNILRGSGLKGISGIAPVRDNLYIRPLLKLRRSEIEQYGQQKGLSFRMDSSNLEIVYRRNKLRHQLIPLLEKEYSPALIPILSRMSEQLREEDEYMEELARGGYQKVLLRTDGPGPVLHRKLLMNQPVVLLRRIIRIAYQEVRATKQGITFAHVENLISHIMSGGPERIIEMPGAVKVRLASDILIFEDGAIEQHWSKRIYSLEVPGSATMEEGIKITSQIIRRDEIPVDIKELAPAMAAIDCDNISLPLEVRFRQEGDAFIPYGLGKKVKLKKFMIDRKIPRHLRNKIPLVVEKKTGRIIWVCGIRLADHIGITSLTKKVILLSLENGNDSIR